MLAQQRTISRLVEQVNSRQQAAQAQIDELTSRRQVEERAAEAAVAAAHGSFHRAEREALITEFRDAAITMAVEMAGQHTASRFLFCNPRIGTLDACWVGCT